MEFLWSPWRFKYLVNNINSPECVFCALPAANNDEKHHIVFRGKLNFVILNLFPYNSGHLMIVPYQHTALLHELDEATSAELMSLTKLSQQALMEEYSPQGTNIGINQGRAAGAGIADHIHLHIVPRWVGDANFMSVIGETRVLPEELEETWRRLSERFQLLTAVR